MIKFMIEIYNSQNRPAQCKYLYDTAELVIFNETYLVYMCSLNYVIRRLNSLKNVSTVAAIGLSLDIGVCS